MTITEVAHIVIRPGLKPEDTSTEAGQLMQKAHETLKSQEGVESVYWGREIENPDRLLLLINWDQLESHKKFMAQPYYQPFLEGLSPLVAAPVAFYHVPFQPHTAPEFEKGLSPIVEVLSIYFAADVSESDGQAFVDGLSKLVGAIIHTSEGFHGSSGGWALENDVAIPGSTETGKVFVGLLGWESVEAHMAARESAAFKENTKHVADVQGLKSRALVHVAFTKA